MLVYHGVIVTLMAQHVTDAANIVESPESFAQMLGLTLSSSSVPVTCRITKTNAVLNQERKNLRCANGVIWHLFRPPNKTPHEPRVCWHEQYHHSSQRRLTLVDGIHSLVHKYADSGSHF